MNNAAFLKLYRETWLELRVMERQLAMSGTTGRPRGASTLHYDDMPRGTNDHTAAAIQQQDGIEAAVNDLRAQLDGMEPRYTALLKFARNYRDRCILRQYYQLCQTDAQIADCLCVSVRHANRLRAELLHHLDNVSTMSETVVACPAAS
ncbi:MAG: hypothetical protein E7316_10485 [Clostridiales bacterium]|nr:hypothetical protein [Clostridiales bacterium]